MNTLEKLVTSVIACIIVMVLVAVSGGPLWAAAGFGYLAFMVESKGK